MSPRTARWIVNHTPLWINRWAWVRARRLRLLKLGTREWNH